MAKRIIESKYEDGTIKYQAQTSRIHKSSKIKKDVEVWENCGGCCDTKAEAESCFNPSSEAETSSKVISETIINL